MAGNAELQNGRRRKVTREGQALPLFMSAGRNRVSEPVFMSLSTSREMNRYVRWASEAARVGRGEAQAMMLDRAIWDYIKKDEAWQAEKSAFAFEPLDEASAEDASAAPKGTPPSLRPTAQAVARVADGSPERGVSAENPPSKGK
jgi:hypothetical protein